MKLIQVDMFPVGLGASILCHFSLKNGGVVTVLADGGVGPGVKADLVKNELVGCRADFDSASERRIDLMIGTHYDADHLRGLTQVALDHSISIGQVWLPPLRDEDASEHMIADSSFIAEQFFDDDSPDRRVLRSYLQAKANEISQLKSLIKELDGERRLGQEPIEPLPQLQDGSREDFSREVLLDCFAREESIAAGLVRRHSGIESEHGDTAYDSDLADLREGAQRAISKFGVHDWFSYTSVLNGLAKRDRTVASVALSRIVQSIARGAITACHLDALVEALRKRPDAVRPECHWTPVGAPIRYVWDDVTLRFKQKPSKDGTDEIELMLLGPSIDLVQKHWAKLPSGSYLAALFFGFTPIIRQSISASNQLSYVVTLEMDHQRILLCGDAGCYGFRPRRGAFYPRLLQQLTRLDVVQVAHHAGQNYDFYNALLAAGFAASQRSSFLLLSHDVHDKKRPSALFAQFLAQVWGLGSFVKLLFASEPDPARVASYKGAVHGPVGPVAAAGLVRLSYPRHDGLAAWTVERHAVRV